MFPFIPSLSSLNDMLKVNQRAQSSDFKILGMSYMPKHTYKGSLTFFPVECFLLYYYAKKACYPHEYVVGTLLCSHHTFSLSSQGTWKCFIGHWWLNKAMCTACFYLFRKKAHNIIYCLKIICCS